jgi:lauroyl/myristoyl acyltransferase
MAEELRVDFQHTVAQLLEHDIGCRILAMATPAQLAELAEDIAATDLYNFPSVLNVAAGFLPSEHSPDRFVRRHLEHLLWAQHRRALWRSGRVRSPESLGCRFSVEGREHFEATLGQPTILITPMTLVYEDALWIAKLIGESRECVIYGEGLNQDDIFDQVAGVIDLSGSQVVSGAAIAPREILRVLKRGGLFLTYPDFVYDEHGVQHAQFMGMRWPFSSSFIKLCARPGTMLLPCFIEREANDLVVNLEQPVKMVLPEGEQPDPRWAQHVAAATVAQLLEEMILRNPAQWLLLSTLVAECMQRAD